MVTTITQLVNSTVFLFSWPIISVVFLRASTIQFANHIRLLDASTFLSGNSTIFLGCQFVGKFRIAYYFCRQISCLCGTSTTQLAKSVAFFRASTIQLANHIWLLDASYFSSENSTIFLKVPVYRQFFKFMGAYYFILYQIEIGAFCT